MIITKSYLSDIAQRKNYDFSAYSKHQALNENRRLYEQENIYDLFLSHSYLDRSLVYSLVELFNKSGYSVYVDWMQDFQLDRNQVTMKTSEILKKRMNMSRGLAYIATNNSSHSKWCPWELGYEDGKTNGRCAILPILEDSKQSFKGQEYLGLYPYLQYALKAGSSEYDFWVYNNENADEYVILSQWLNGHNPSKH